MIATVLTTVGALESFRVAEISAPSAAGPGLAQPVCPPLGPHMVMSPSTVIVMSPPLPPSMVLSAVIAEPACITRLPVATIVIGHALAPAGSPESLHSMIAPACRVRLMTS